MRSKRILPAVVVVGAALVAAALNGGLPWGP